VNPASDAQLVEYRQNAANSTTTVSTTTATTTATATITAASAGASASTGFSSVQIVSVVLMLALAGSLGTLLM
jgi:alkylhydroperoxidase family enzyme